jgi:hypothetical protein
MVRAACVGSNLVPLRQTRQWEIIISIRKFAVHWMKLWNSPLPGYQGALKKSLAQPKTQSHQLARIHFSSFTFRFA